MNLNELEKKNDAVVVIVGEEMKVNPTAPVKDTLKDILQKKGIDSFTILVDGDEIGSTDDLPEKFEDHDIEVKRFVKAG